METDLVVYVSVGFLSTIVWFFLVRWAHRITAKVDRLNASVLLLAEIALKQGVSSDKVDGILNSNMIQYTINNEVAPRPAPNPNDPYALPSNPGLIKDNR